MWSAMGAAFRSYARFGGRTERSVFEPFFMFQVVVGGVLMLALLLIALVGALSSLDGGDPNLVSTMLMGLVVLAFSLYGLVLFLPTTAMIVRRLHDTNRSGWWFWGWFAAYIVFMVIYLILIVALAAAQNEAAIYAVQAVSYFFSIPLSVLMYFLLYWLAQPGTAGENRFGPALVEFEPDSPVDGLQAQASGFFQGIGRAWAQNWRRFGIQGRLSRSEYWCFHAILLPLILLVYVLLLLFSAVAVASGATILSGIIFIIGIALTAVMIGMSVIAGIRRLHDIGYSGWWILVMFILPLGGMALLYLVFKPSIAGGNRFGPQPMPML